MPIEVESPEELGYDDLYTRLEEISKMNRIGTSFLGDGDGARACTVCAP